VLLIPKRHRQTDRRTDGRLTIALPRSALASRGKNESIWRTKFLRFRARRTGNYWWCSVNPWLWTRLCSVINREVVQNRVEILTFWTSISGVALKLLSQYG